jgi:hypothetical protein
MWWLIVRERRVEAPNIVGDPVFSRDGRRVGYGALVGRELWWKVIDLDALSQPR